jgi:hypothetical protein
MTDDTSPSGSSGEIPRFAARSMMSLGIKAMLKASTDAAVRPLMAEVSKAFLGASLPKTFLGGGVPKVVLGVGLPRPELGGFAKLTGARRGPLGSPSAHRPGISAIAARRGVGLVKLLALGCCDAA